MSAVAPTLAQRLGSARVDLRPDLQVFRHLFRGEPSYVVRDPASMQSHRFGPHEYQILVRISSEKSLAEIHADLVREGVLGDDDLDDFYRFVVSLHNLAFLNLPVSDDRALYRRHVARERARRRERLLGFLSLRIPVWNPDDFLDRTVRYVSWIFSRGAFIVWGLAVLAALGFAAQNWRELVSPVHSILAVANLPVLWIALIALKAIHELGHAYACKARGGGVPEMGIMLVLLTPLAYVDATSAWGFVRRRDRLAVSLAGMYVESIIAVAALAVWATTPSASVRIVAHDVLLLASVVTIALNANPLMRFDGYYVVSDLLEIPNLRARSEKAVRSVAKKFCFGIDDPVPDTSKRLVPFLVVFGVASVVYRVVLVVSVSLLVATKAFLLGIAFAVGYVGHQLWRAVRGLAAYLLHSSETATRRVRAVGIGAALLAGVPLVALFVPVPESVRAQGVVRREHERVVRAEQGGFLERVMATPGERIEPGTLLARLENPLLEAKVSEAEADAEVAGLRAATYRAEASARAVPESRIAAASRATLEERRRELAALEVRSDFAGTLVSAVSNTERGRFVKEGEPIATLAAGPFLLRVAMSEHEVASVGPKPGDPVRVRIAAAPWRTIEGEVVRIVPAGSRAIEHDALTQEAGGEIPVGADDRRAPTPYFELSVRLPESAGAEVRDGMRGQALFVGKSEPLATSLLRRVLRAGNRILQG
jgi:putative peptide zinc metalloprotease protein